MSETKYFNVTVLAADATELERIDSQLATRIDDVLHVEGKKGCYGSFRVRSEAYETTYQYLQGVSAAFPSAVFLVEAYNLESWTNKMVLHGGQLLRETNDNDSHTQFGIWVSLNIFEPFRVEYELGLPVGSLWKEWVADVIKAAHALRVPPAYATEPPEPLDLTFSDGLPEDTREPRPGEAADLIQKRMLDHAWRTLCNVCHQPVRAGR